MKRIGIVFVGAVVLTTTALCAAFGSVTMLVAVTALGIWLAGAAVALRRPEASSSSPSASAGARHTPVLDVDPLVFDDVAATEGCGLEVFNAWARRARGAPSDVSSLARAVRVSHPVVGRFTTTVEVRRFIWRQQSANGSTVAARTAIERLDPWSAPVDLRQQTRSVTACGQCSGAGRVSCRRCGGRGRVSCGDCSGTGKSYQTAKNGSRRLMNCGSCSKTGLRSCGCAAGSVSCDPCSGTGGFERWAEVEVDTRDRAESLSTGGHLLPFDWARDPAAQRSTIKIDATFIDDVSRPRALTAADVETIGGTDLLNAWQQGQERLPAGARITRQHLEVLQLPVVDVTWGLGTRERHVELYGRRLLAPPGESADLFADRAHAHRVGAIAAFVGVGAVVLSTVARGPFFASSPSYGSWAAVVAAATLGLLWVNRATLTKPGSGRWAASSLACVVAAFVGAACAAPKIDHVQQLLEAKSFEAARIELTALDGVDSDRYARAWATLRLLDVEAATSGTERATLAGLIRSDLQEHTIASSMVDAAYAIEADAQLRAGDARTAKTTLSHLSAAARMAAQPLALAADTAIANDCERAGDWRCAFEHAALVSEVDVVAGERLKTSVVQTLKATATKATNEARARKNLTDRDHGVADAVALWRVLREQDPAVEAKLQESLKLQTDTSRAVLRQQEVERKRQATIEARQRAQAEAEARREAQRQRQRDWWNSPLQCCDGSRSPTCTQGGGHRGCCSHHGGVCG